MLSAKTVPGISPLWVAVLMRPHRANRGRVQGVDDDGGHPPLLQVGRDGDVDAGQEFHQQLAVQGPRRVDPHEVFSLHLVVLGDEGHDGDGERLDCGIAEGTATLLGRHDVGTLAFGDFQGAHVGGRVAGGYERGGLVEGQDDGVGDDGAVARLDVLPDGPDVALDLGPLEPIQLARLGVSADVRTRANSWMAFPSTVNRKIRRPFWWNRMQGT